MSMPGTLWIPSSGAGGYLPGILGCFTVPSFCGLPNYGPFLLFPSRSSILEAREFEWESQLRFYWDREPDELNIRQCTGTFGYGYEYMGLNGRLVITPLTDRIYLTLTQVMLAPQT